MDSPIQAPALDDDAADDKPASALLEELVGVFPEERVTIGEILDRLDGRAVGVLLLLLALPMCIPNIPGVSTLFGLLLIAPALQLTFANDKAWLPRRAKRWTVPRQALERAIQGGAPLLRKIERVVRPSWTVFVRRPATQLLGLQTLAMALVLLLPIPGGNWPPGMTVAATGLALVQRDGRLALLTVPMGLVSIGVAWVGYRLGLAVLTESGRIINEAFGVSWF
ncbi:MAG: exopolysaccharide biosynthesis protein [Hyphomonadaceae bacterium]